MRFHTIRMRFPEFPRNGAKLGSLGLVVLIALAALCLCAVSASAQPAPRFTLPTDPSTPVLVMRQRPTELGEGATQELRVFADGRCSLYRPAIMRGAGEHHWTISPEEVAALLGQALDAGLADFDAKAHRANLRRRADSAAGGIQHFRFDDDTIEFDLRVDGYRSPGRSARRDVRRSIEWRGLRTDRARHPEDIPVRLLIELRDQLDKMGRERAHEASQP